MIILGRYIWLSGFKDPKGTSRFQRSKSEASSLIGAFKHHVYLWTIRLFYFVSCSFGEKLLLMRRQPTKTAISDSAINDGPSDDTRKFLRQVPQAPAMIFYSVVPSLFFSEFKRTVFPMFNKTFCGGCTVTTRGNI